MPEERWNIFEKKQESARGGWGWVSDVWNNPRFQGGIQMVSGYAETKVGLGFTASVVLAPVGVMMMAHGADQFSTGMHTFLTGTYHDTVTSQTLQYAGMSQNDANFNESVASVLLGNATNIIDSGRKFGFIFKASQNRQAAQSINAATHLAKKLSNLQTVQRTTTKIRYLKNGRIRYYGTEILASKPGPTRGSAFVTELDTRTGRVRTWMESYAHSGKVIRIHPKQIDGQEVVSLHYPPIGKEL